MNETQTATPKDFISILVSIEERNGEREYMQHIVVICEKGRENDAADEAARAFFGDEKAEKIDGSYYHSNGQYATRSMDWKEIPAAHADILALYGIVEEPRQEGRQAMDNRRDRIKLLNALIEALLNLEKYYPDRYRAALNDARDERSRLEAELEEEGNPMIRTVGDLLNHPAPPEEEGNRIADEHAAQD